MFQCHLPLKKRAVDLIFDIAFKAADTQTPDVFRGIIFRVCNGSRVQHIHQGSKTFGTAIVWGGRQHDHGIAAVGKQFCKARTLCLMVTTFGNILRFINNDNVPICFFQMCTVFHIAF